MGKHKQKALKSDKSKSTIIFCKICWTKFVNIKTVAVYTDARISIVYSTATCFKSEFKKNSPYTNKVNKAYFSAIFSDK